MQYPSYAGFENESEEYREYVSQVKDCFVQFLKTNKQLCVDAFIKKNSESYDTVISMWNKDVSFTLYEQETLLKQFYSGDEEFIRLVTDFKITKFKLRKAFNFYYYSVIPQCKCIMGECNCIDRCEDCQGTFEMCNCYNKQLLVKF